MWELIQSITNSIRKAVAAARAVAEKIKNFTKGIKETFEKIKKAFQFFMTQVRNGCGANNIGFDNHRYTYGANKNDGTCFG